MIKKNETYQGIVSAQGKRGEGIVQRDEFPIYIPNAIPGDNIKFKVLKIEKRRAFGKLIQLVSDSPDRVHPKCSIAVECGGCQLQHQHQTAQINFKTSLLQDRLSRFIDLSGTSILPLLFGTKHYETRNKMQFAFAMGQEGLQIGLYAPRSHRVVNVTNCEIMSAPMNAVLSSLKHWHLNAKMSVFDEQTGAGVLRHVVIRYSYATGQLMVIVTVGQLFDETSMVDALSEVSGMTSIYLSLQPDPTNDGVLGDKLIQVWGSKTITDRIGKVQAIISPKTFMQANAHLVQDLYNSVINQLSLDHPVYDLYCGAGVLSCAIALAGYDVIAIDNNPSAISDAKANAVQNDVTIQFKCQDVIQFLTSHPDSNRQVIVDPPRQGLAGDVIQALNKLAPKKIIYVSCFPDTLGRDLRLFAAGGYKIQSLQGVDMFCHTPHIEAIVVLVK